MTAAPIAVLTRDQLDELLEAAAERGARRALAVERDSGRELSAAQAAKRAHRRMAVVLAALKDGSLPGTFTPGGHGGRGSWSITASAIDAWAAS